MLSTFQPFSHDEVGHRMKSNDNCSDKIKTSRNALSQPNIFEKIFWSLKVTVNVIAGKFFTIPSEDRCQHSIGRMLHDVKFKHPTNKQWRVLWQYKSTGENDVPYHDWHGDY